MKIEDNDTLIHSLKALKLINESIKSKVLDLSQIEKITPFYIAPITSFLKINKDIEIKYPEDPYKLFYLDTLKFPETISEIKKYTTTYIPLYEIKSELGEGEENGEILDLLEKIIINTFDLKINYQLLMSVFNELICNIQQHSKSSFNCIQAQLYEDKLAISLVDTGISIQNSYINSGFPEESSIGLFENAFKGISTKIEKERGTGIPNTYNWICKGLKGNLVIISKDSAFKKIKSEMIEFINLSDLNLKFNGTIINISFNIPKEKIDIYPLINKPLN